jgi:peptidoglycan/LPS O-acetylase OafA/YrhL
MRRERLTQAALVIVGLFNLALIRFLYKDLWHSAWLLQGKNEIEPMFLSVFITIGLFLLLAVKRPSQHRSMIAFIGWWNIAHSSVMVVETVESWKHHFHRNFDDVILFFVIGVILLALLPPRSAQVH